jgi:arsenite methyltransferase
MTRNDTEAEVREQVRARYAAAARAVSDGGGAGCCGPAAEAIEVDERFGAGLYDAATTEGLPEAALLASLGCGNPVAVADLHEGERVLDLGSGGGIDVLLSARRVGPTGFAYGVDMTDEMLDLARENAAKAGASNVEFRNGAIEDLPLDDASVDVVISNCVVNLSTDKPAVLAETFRVLAPGGRLGISDVVADDDVSPAQRAERGSHVGCVAGALSRAEYLEGLATAGFTDASITFTHEVAPGLHGAVVRARKPAAAAEGGPCCAPTEAAVCCGPSAKASCCGAGAAVSGTVPDSCGCRS